MIIRNNKDNIMFKSGYAFEDGRLVFSNMYLSDDKKTRQEIEEDIDYLTQKRINEVNANNIDISEKDRYYFESKPIRKYNLGLTMISTAILGTLFMIKAFSIAIESAYNKSMLMVPLALSLFSFIGFAYAENKYNKINKIKKKVQNEIFVKKQIKDKELDLEYAVDNEQKNEMEKEIVISELVTKPIDSISNILDVSFKEKLKEKQQEVKTLQYTNRKGL